MVTVSRFGAGKLAFSGLVLALATSCHAHVRAPVGAGVAEGDVLPLERVRLFENGVGYFEREGKLETTNAVLPVPASHVDDALKTLVVLSGQGTKVGGVEFASVVSGGTARALAGLRLDDATPLGFDDVLESLEGYRVRLLMSAGASFSGRLIDVQSFEKLAVAKPDDQPATDPASDEDDVRPAPKAIAAKDFWLFVVGDDGSLRRLPFSGVTSIAPLDPGFSSRLQTATDALSGRAAQLARNLRVLASSGSPVRLGYVAEAPVWRASYRLVMGPAHDEAMVQGWALIHNDTDEAWAGVSVELVNGQPDSFLFPMAAPRYTRRPMATPEEQLSTVPQLALKTPDAIWGDHTDEGEESSGIGLGSVGTTGQGFGAGHGRLGGSHRTRGAAEASDAISIGDLARLAEARAQNEGTLYSYRLADAVSLRAHGSALLPFFAKRLDAKRLTRFEAASKTGRAAIRLANASPNTLPAGPLAVFERAGFSGETVLQRLRPGERVFLSYGIDLDAELDSKPGNETRETRKLVFDAERLEEHYVRTREIALTLQNRSAARRTIAYTLVGTVSNAEVRGADSLDYDSATATPLALFELQPGAKLERKLVVVEALQDRFAPSELREAIVGRLLKAPSLDAAARAALTGVQTEVAAIDADLERQNRLVEERRSIDEDLERHREHLKAVGGSGGSAADPLTKRILELETQRARARAELDELARRLATLRKRASAELERLRPAQ